MVQIGFPHDPVVTAKKKEATLKDLINTRSRAWSSYVKLLSLAYDQAYHLHTGALTAIREKLRNNLQFMQQVLFGAIIPSFLGGGMAVLVSSQAKAAMSTLFDVAKKNQKTLLDMGVAGVNSVAKDLTKLESSNVLNSTLPHYGSEWSAVADNPLRFFLQLDKTIDDFGTDAIADIELSKALVKMDTIDDYIAKIDGYLLSPFIQKAPMERDRLYTDSDLEPLFEVFMWVYWAKNRDISYWSTQISRATEPDDRSMVGKIWDAAWSDDDDLKRSQAEAAVETLDPILDRLTKCGIQPHEVTQPLGDMARPPLSEYPVGPFPWPEAPRNSAGGTRRNIGVQDAKAVFRRRPYYEGSASFVSLRSLTRAFRCLTLVTCGHAFGRVLRAVGRSAGFASESKEGLLRDETFRGAKMTIASSELNAI